MKLNNYEYDLKMLNVLLFYNMRHSAKQKVILFYYKWYHTKQEEKAKIIDSKICLS